MRAALYARVQEFASSESLTAQQTACRLLAERRGYIITDEFTDRGSGSEYRSRPALNTLRERIRNRAVDVVIAYGPDRLSRKPNHIQDLVDEATHFSVCFEFVQE